MQDIRYLKRQADMLYKMFVKTSSMAAVGNAVESSRYHGRMLLEISQSDLISQVNSSGLAGELKKAAQDIVTARVNEIVDAASVLDGVTDLAGLQQILGKNLNIAQFKELDDSSEPEAVQEIIDTARNEIKQLYKSTLDSEMKRMQSVGGGALTSIYKSGLSRIG
jgi:hypothetical protein